MILSKTILIGLGPENIKYFEKLGYSLPKYTDNKNRIRVKKGSKLQVNINDLPPNSTVKLLCKCDGCGKERLLTYHSIINDKCLCYKCKFNTPEYIEIQTKINTGKNNPNYDFNLSDKERIQNHRIDGINTWKRKVKQKDNYMCQKCASKYKLHVHHINNYKQFKEQRLDIDNGITLCFDCHLSKNNSIHSIYGKYTNRKHLIEFLQ